MFGIRKEKRAKKLTAGVTSNNVRNIAQLPSGRSLWPGGIALLGFDEPQALRLVQSPLGHGLLP